MSYVLCYDVDGIFGVVYEEALGTTTLIRPYLARALLGWRPRKAGLVDGLSAYYQAYLAARA